MTWDNFVPKSQLMLYFRIVVLMYPISLLMHMLNILDSFNMGVTNTVFETNAIL